MAHADFYAHRVLLFINNPHQAHGQYPDPTGMGLSWDVLTAPDSDDYSVPVNAKSVEDGDIALVYRVGPHASRRDPGSIVALARITSSPWYCRWGTGVNWELRLLPPECWIDSEDMKQSGLWTSRVPFTLNEQATTPVHLDVAQWEWLKARLPDAGIEWLALHAAKG